MKRSRLVDLEGYVFLFFSEALMLLAFGGSGIVFPRVLNHARRSESIPRKLFMLRAIRKVPRSKIIWEIFTRLWGK